MISKIHLLLFLFYSSEAFIIDNYYEEDPTDLFEGFNYYTKPKNFPKEIIVNFDEIENSKNFRISYTPNKKLNVV